MKSAQDLQQKILGALSIRGGMSTTELAKGLGRKSHVIRYHLTQLLEAGHLKQSVLIDQRALGFQICNLLFNLPPHKREAALKFLQEHPRVAWVFQNHGSREFEVSVNVKNMGELVTLSKAFGAATGLRFHDQVMAFEEDMVGWGYRYTSPHYHHVSPLEFRSPKPFDADALDLKLIRAYRSAQDTSFSSLARLVGAPQSTIKDRLNKLEKGRVISEPRYLLVSGAGNIMQAQILLKVSVRSDETEARLTKICQELRHVTSLTSCFGDWDYKVVVHGEGLNAFIETHDSLKQVLSNQLVLSDFSLRRRWLKTSAGV